MRRTIVVAGGSRGMGKEIARSFAERGERVIITGRDEARLNETAAELGVDGIRCDGSRVDDVERLAEAVHEGVDVLVNVAGSNVLPSAADPDAPTLAEVAAHWRSNLDANLMTTVLTTTALLPLIRPGGTIIGFSSLAAEYSPIPYAVAKAAVSAWISGLSSKVGPTGITANTIVPGYTTGTDFFPTPPPDEQVEAMIAAAHTRRAATAQDITGLVLFLASEDARHLTGQTLHVSGGSHTTR